MNKSNEPAIIAAQDITKQFKVGDAVVDILRGIDFSVAAGSSTAIVGSSGSGKSTLLHVLGGLDTPTAGSVAWSGQSLAALSETKRGELRNRVLGFVYQFHHLLPEFTALENVAMPLLIRRTARAEALEQAAAILTSVGLAARVSHTPAQLSGGERQRVALARALVGAPQVVLADEPTGNLDASAAQAVFELMLQLQAERGIAFVVVTHDRGLAAKMGGVRELVAGKLT